MINQCLYPYVCGWGGFEIVGKGDDAEEGGLMIPGRVGPQAPVRWVERDETFVGVRVSE